MWKYTGNEFAARNIITNKIPDGGSNEDLSILGIYYIDANGDFDIYTEETRNYTKDGYKGYDPSTKKISWEWKNPNAKTEEGKEGTDTFVLDEDNFKYKNSNNEEVSGAILMKNASEIIKKIEVVLNRLPKTFKKSPTALKTLYGDSKVLMRINNLTNPVSLNKVSSNKLGSNTALIKKNALQQSLVRANKIAARSSFDVKAVTAATMNQIEPKIQAAYGYADFGKIKDLTLDYISMDDGSFVTTHKIGYEESDRYRIGKSSCDSYLFLSPLNHSEIQVNGDTNRSHIAIKSNESLRVPIVYQYRMEDYRGNIFGNTGYKSTDTIVKNTKYANIIGIDIWLNTLSDTPKQYDIVVYSTYNKDNARLTGTITKKLK